MEDSKSGRVKVTTNLVVSEFLIRSRELGNGNSCTDHSAVPILETRLYNRAAKKAS